MMFASGTEFASLSHKSLLLYIVLAEAIDYDMHMDIAAFIIPVHMGIDESLMSGKIFLCVFQSEPLRLFSGQIIFCCVLRIEAEDIMTGFDFIFRIGRNDFIFCICEPEINAVRMFQFFFFFWSCHKKEYSEDKSEIEFEKLWEGQYLSTGDIVLIAGCGIIGVALAVWYWLLCMIWAYRKSYRMGVNSGLWVLATLFFNLATIAVLYLYATLKGTCDSCGRIRTADGKYCDRCGKLLKKECPDCGQTVDAKAEYCRNCGKKLNEGQIPKGI